jgi:hypothetical protein
MGLIHMEVELRIEPRDDRTQRLQQAARLFLGQLFGECAERLAARTDLLVHDLMALGRDRDEPDPAVRGVLVALDETAPDEGVDVAPRGGLGLAELCGELVDRHRLPVRQREQHPGLREGEIVVGQGLHHLGLADVHQSLDQPLETPGDVGRGLHGGMLTVTQISRQR